MTFGIGFGEIVLIFVIAIIVLGPQEFVKHTKKILGFIRQVTKYKREIETTIHDSVVANPMETTKEKTPKQEA